MKFKLLATAACMTTAMLVGGHAAAQEKLTVWWAKGYYKAEDDALFAAMRATPEDIARIEAAYAGMKQAVYEGGDYITFDLRFHQGLLAASHNRMLVQMSKALSALLRTSFELSTAKENGTRHSLPMHRAVLDAVITHNPAQAERAISVLIDSAHKDIEEILTSRKRLPRMNKPATELRAA